MIHPRNSQFIELHPETALSISWDLELCDPTRVAFRIRVVEDAIELVDPQPVGAVRQLSEKTTFGRPREPLSDELETAIEYGRVKLIERVRHIADCLLSPSHIPLNFLLEPCSQLVGSQWQLLVALGKLLGCNMAGHSDHSGQAIIDLSCLPLRVVHNARNALETLLLALGAYGRALVSYALETPLLLIKGPLTGPADTWNFDKADLDRLCYYTSQSSLEQTALLYKRLSSYQRLLTRYPWERLKSRLDDLECLATFSTEGISLSTRIERLNQYLTPLVYCLPAAFVRFDDFGNFNLFNAAPFALEMRSAAGQIADTWIGTSEIEIPLLRTSFLALGLSPDELAYLPLWAGGNNDETGGIFDEHAVPDADLGPIQPGPSYQTGCSVPSIVSSIVSSIRGTRRHFCTGWRTNGYRRLSRPRLPVRTTMPATGP